MSSRFTRIALLTLAAAFGAAFADSTCGKVEWVFLHVKGNGAIAFKLINSTTPGIPATNAYTIGYNALTSPMAMSQLLTAKATNVNLCVDFPSGTPGSVNSINVMQP